MAQSVNMMECYRYEVDGMNVEESPAKVKPTDFALCIQCQDINYNDKLSKPRDVSSVDTYVFSVNRRCEYGNIDFSPVSQRLRGLTGSDLLSRGIQWHRTCYANTTNKSHIDRDKKNWQTDSDSKKLKGRPSIRVDANTVTRSSSQIIPTQKCFFCGGNDTHKSRETLHACQSENCGKSITEIVNNSNNPQWKVQIADITSDDDFLAKDIVYHNSCKLNAWKTYVQGPEQRAVPPKAEQSTAFLAAEIEFYDNLSERIESGEYITTLHAETLYRDVFNEHGFHDESIPRRKLITNIKQNLPNIVISEHRGNLPGILCSKKSGREAVDLARTEQDMRGDLTSILKCAKIIRRSITNVRKENSWTFKGSLEESSERVIPIELMMMSRWILQGTKVASTASRTQDIHKSCVVISQSVIQEFKTTKQVTHKATSEAASSMFRRQFESPFSVGLSLWMYHNFRSQKAITMLSKSCAGMSYSRITHVCSQIANAIQNNINANSVFVPFGIVKGQGICASADNVDKKVDTSDGKNSFHAMASSVFQPVCSGESLVEPLDLYEVPHGALVDIPSTCIKISKCNIEGTPKPVNSPCYPSYEVGRHNQIFGSALKLDMTWMVARYFNRPSKQTYVVPMPSCNTEETNVSNEITIPTETIALNDRIDPDLDSVTPTTQTVLNVPVECAAENNESEKYDTQRIPVWSAYNSLLNCSSSDQQSHVTVDKVYSLPIINAPPQAWPTLITTLDQLCKLNDMVSGDNRRLIVTFDMDLYKRVLKLEYLDPQYGNRWIVCPGAFHTSVCALRCLGKTIEGSGLEEAWVEADMYSTVTVHQIINGNHYSRGMDAHEITLQVLFDLWLEAFFSERPNTRKSLEASCEILSLACESKHGVNTAHETLHTVIESIDLEQQLADFDARHSGNAMFHWARNYMDQVMTMLQFQRATRQGDWLLHLSSLEKLCAYFFVYNRHDYARQIPEYVARMYELQTTDPQTWSFFASGGFTVNTSNQIPFTRLGLDQAQEQQNKTLKGQGAINGITQSPATLLKFCMCAPELARLATEAEAMVGIEKQASSVHHCLNQPSVRRQERAITQLHGVLVQCNIFTSDEPDMYKLMTKEIIPNSVKESILAIEKQGSLAMKSFVEERICGDANLWDKITQCKNNYWNATTKELKLQTKSEVLTIRASAGLMSRFLIIARSSRQIDLEEVIGNYELSTSNRVLMKPDGSVHPTVDKSKLIGVLEQLPTDVHDAPQAPNHYTNTTLIIDAMAVVQELMSVKQFVNCKSLGDAFVSIIDSRTRRYDLARVVFDNYSVEGSLKEATRERRRGTKPPASGYKVEDSTKIKNNKSFLGSTVTKDSLTQYLAQKLIDHAHAHVITATHRSVMSNRTGDINPGVSSQEEADTLMILHATHAAKDGVSVHIMSPDTDVLLLALRRVPLLGDNIAMIMGVGERRRLILLKPIYDVLGSNKASALPKWHALTGSDTTGHINGKSKKACFEALLKASPGVISSVSALGIGSEPSEETIQGCVSFLCSLFCKKGITITQPHTLRWTLFKQQGSDKGVDMLPPTFGAWLEHIKRAHCQAAIWEQDLVLNPVVPDPTKLGWIQQDDRLLPELSKIAPAPAAVVELVRCSCGASNPNATNKCASARCSCRVSDLDCTELCRCEAEADTCQNMNNHTVP